MADKAALAGRQSVYLDYDREFLSFSDERLDFVNVIENPEVGRGDSVASHKLTRVGLGAFQKGRFFGWADDFKAGIFEFIDDTFDERDEAVMLSLEKAIKVAKSMGITSSICGQAPSVYPEITEKLVEWGITSISVSPDMIDRTREIIADMEARLGFND